MICERCGQNNFDESEKCIFCGSKLSTKEDKEDFIEKIKNQEPIYKEPVEFKPAAVIFTAIWYPLIYFLVGFFMFIYNELELIGFILSIIPCLLGSVCLYLGGFYCYFIPLPYISLFKGGCCREFKKEYIKVLLGVGGFLLPALSILFVFLFKK